MCVRKLNLKFIQSLDAGISTWLVNASFRMAVEHCLFAFALDETEFIRCAPTFWLFVRLWLACSFSCGFARTRLLTGCRFSILVAWCWLALEIDDACFVRKHIQVNAFLNSRRNLPKFKRDTKQKKIAFEVLARWERC